MATSLHNFVQKTRQLRVSGLRIGSGKLGPPALALFAALPDVIVCADAAAAAVLAVAPLAVKLADARAPAVLAGAPLRLCGQMFGPPQSLQ